MRYRFIILLALVLISINDLNAITDTEKQQLIETGLPLVVVETVNHEEPTFEIAVAPPDCLGQSIKNATKVPGRLVIINGEKTTYDSGEYESGTSGITIKVRGNWSANYLNHPYKIKLQKKDDLLCRGDKRYKDRDWLLLRVPNLNTLIGFKINEMLGLQWTPCYQYVNVLLNGDYQGLYMLAESVDRNADCRLNVDKSSGYIFELDAYWWNEDLSVKTSFDWNMNYTFKYPDSEDITDEQLSNFEKYIYQMEASLMDATYTEYIDVESFANWMLAHDILGDTDAAGSNIFLTKYDDFSTSKIMMGPLWDYDWIMNAEEWAYIHKFYYFSLLFESENETFRNTYSRRWKDVKGTLFDSLFEYFDQFVESPEGHALNAAILYHNNRWPEYKLQTVQTYFESAKSYFETRKSWLDENIVFELCDGVGFTVENENEFVLVDLYGNRYLPFLRTDKTLHYQFTDKVDLSQLVPLAPKRTDYVLWEDEKLPFDGKSHDFSDFTRNIFFVTRNDLGEDDSLKVVIYDLPVLIISTPDSLPIDSKTERKEGCLVKLVTNNVELNLGTAGIKGRGNSSWVEPKKPYNIKLDKKAEILGMKKSKHWILLANAKYDRTQLHNATAFEIARLTDYPWIPSGRYVELVLNGVHKGLYYLCEKIRIEKGKIDIEMDEDKEDVTNCAYLLESLVKTGENNPVELNLNQFDTGIINATGHDPVWCTFGWEISEPEDNIVIEQSDYIRESLTNVEKLIIDDIDSGQYRDFFDIETAINWWFTEELCINEEASRTKNVYLYKKGKDGKICLGPGWDFDAWSFGTAGLRTFWAKDYALYYRYLFKDPVFVNRVKEKWAEYRPIWEEKIRRSSILPWMPIL